MRSETTNAKNEPVAVASTDAERASFTPNVDIVRGQDEVLIFADVPGTTADGIEVSFDRGMLQLFARVPRRALPGNPLREEYAVGDWRRSFTLSEEYDGSKTSAEYHDGVLCLRVPKAAQARAHRVAIRAGQG